MYQELIIVEANKGPHIKNKGFCYFVLSLSIKDPECDQAYIMIYGFL